MNCPICCRKVDEREHYSDRYKAIVLEYQCTCNNAGEGYLVNFHLTLSKAIFAPNQSNLNHILELSLFLDTAPKQILGYNYFKEDDITGGQHWEVFTSDSDFVLSQGTEPRSTEDAFKLLQRYKKLLIFS